MGAVVMMVAIFGWVPRGLGRPKELMGLLKPQSDWALELCCHLGTNGCLESNGTLGSADACLGLMGLLRNQGVPS